jgi:hypothetical protein
MTAQDILIYGGILVAWYLLNRFLLPKMGVAT